MLISDKMRISIICLFVLPEPKIPIVRLERKNKKEGLSAVDDIPLEVIKKVTEQTQKFSNHVAGKLLENSPGDKIVNLSELAVGLFGAGSKGH